MLQKSLTATALTAALLLTGCANTAAPAAPVPVPAVSESAPEPAPAPESNTPTPTDQPDKLYWLNVNRQTWMVDGNGNKIPADEAEILTETRVLADALTGEPMLKTRVREFDTGVDDEYGNPITDVEGILYDLDGNILHDWDVWTYTDGFGDFVVRSNDWMSGMHEFEPAPADYRCELWNYKTDAVQVPNVDWVNRVDDETALLVRGYYDQRVLLGTYDRAGELLAAFSGAAGSYASTHEGVVIANTDNGDSVVYNRLMEPLYSFKRAMPGGVMTDGEQYLSIQQGQGDDERNSVVRALTGEVLFMTPAAEQYLPYFDGELLIMTDGNGGPSALYKADGTKLSTDYGDLIPAMPGEIDDTAPAPYFLGLRGGKVEELNRDGTVGKSADATGATGLWRQGDGLYSVQYDGESERLINAALETLIPEGKYMWIRRMSDYQDGVETQYDLLECAYYVSTDLMARDIRTLDNELVIDRVDSASVGPNRLLVKRGFSVGLIDWSGNWIVKESIFMALDDDYSIGGFY